MLVSLVVLVLWVGIKLNVVIVDVFVVFVVCVVVGVSVIFINKIIVFSVR